MEWAYAKDHRHEIDGILFYKVDRAARNMFDYIELERLESELNIPFVSVSQTTEHAGREVQRRVLASMASYTTEQQALDVREGLAKRVESGFCVGLALYGYRNVRPDGRSLVEVDPVAADKVGRVFDLYAYEHCTIGKIVERMAKENVPYTDTQHEWPRKVATILRDRAYIGEVKHKGQWHPGTPTQIVHRATWDRAARFTRPVN